MPQQWIQQTKLKKNTLRKYIQRNWGKAGFTTRGTIQVAVLHAIAAGEQTPQGAYPSRKTQRRARLALTLRKLSKRK